MKRSLKSRLDAHFAAVSAVAMAGGAAAPARGVVIYSGPVAINIPSTTAGVYVNVVTGVADINPANVPGWDVNPWNTAGLYLFNPAAPTGGVYAGGTAPANLVIGTVI